MSKKQAPEVPIETAVASAENSAETVCAHLKEFQFKPGESGNPGGRPKRRLVTEIYEELLADAETREAIKKALRDRLTSGRMVAAIEMKEMADRTEGKVSQPVEGEFTIIALSERMRKARERSA